MSRRDPFDDIEEILDVVTGGLDSSAGTLPVDVADTGDAFVVVADLPGYDRDDVTVTLPDETTLSLAAERETDAVAESERYVTRERTNQSVTRRVGLPDPVVADETSASYEGGVLTVTLPKQHGSGGDDTEIPVE
jgi:HSP20 family protein